MRNMYFLAVLLTVTNGVLLTVTNGLTSYAQSNYPPNSQVLLYEPTDSKPGGVVATPISILKLSRLGTYNHSYNESAEFRIGHGGPTFWGSRLDLFINGGYNHNNIPDQHAMSWLYNGNVGIGTSTPRRKLTLVDQTWMSTDVVKLLNLSREHGEGVTFGVYVGEFVTDSYGFTINQRLQGTNTESETFRISNTGNVGIGTTIPTEKLSVNGKIRAKEIKVETGWADFVFEPSYTLLDLTRLEQFIKKNRHLPEIPSAKEVLENGIELGQMNAKLLQKIEELTLYLIEMNKNQKLLERKVEVLQARSEH